MSNIIQFPLERTKKHQVDRASAYAEKVQRLVRLSDRPVETFFRRDQVRASQ